jgi:small subunit ribosomal protein S6
MMANEIHKEESVRVYEVLFIINPNVEEANVDALVTQLSDVATNQGARVAKVDRMGRRRLAYPIQRFTEGIYFVLTLEGTGSEIAELERRMRVTDTIIRYITVRIDEDLKRADKFRARRAARMAAGGGRGGRSRQSEPVLPIGNEEAEEEDE